MLLFSFVRSLHQSCFSLFTASFEALLPWLAALDNSNYLRWGCIFFCEMYRPSASATDEFVKCYFTLKKSEIIFQLSQLTKPPKNNKPVKTDGGAIGILDNDEALLEWAVSGPYIANMVCSTENTLSTNDHEENDSFEKDFREKRSSLIETFKTFDNPFTDYQPDLINMASKEVMSEKAASSVINTYNVGKKQCSDFINATVTIKECQFTPP